MIIVQMTGFMQSVQEPVAGFALMTQACSKDQLALVTMAMQEAQNDRPATVSEGSQFFAERSA